MGQEGEIESAVQDEQLSQVQDFVQNLTYYNSVPSCTTLFVGDFFDVAGRALLGAATIAWCNVFANPKSHLYWSKLIAKMPEKVKLDFLNRVHKSTGLTGERYKEYQRSILTMRDKYVAHTDLNWQAHVSQNLSFDKALRIAMQYECWLNDLLHKGGYPEDNSDSLNDIIKSAKTAIKHLTKILSSQEK